MSAVVFVNGQLVEPGQPAIRPDDRGFTLGDGLFETLRAYQGTPFRLDAHLARLRQGAERIALPLPPDLRDQVDAAVAAFVAIERAASQSGAVRDASIRVTVSRGPARPGLDSPASGQPTVVVSVHPYAPRPEWYEAGIDVITATGRLNEFGASAGLKRLGYLDAMLALQEARARGADDAVFLDTSGHLAEGTTSNLFLVVGGTIMTPPVECGILAGVTRATVLEVARGAGLDARETVLVPEVLAEAEEAFLTGSNREIVPIRRFDERTIGSGRPGPVTLDLLERYRTLVRAETAGVR